MLLKNPAQQKQLTQTSVIKGDTQVHAVVTSAPGTGKFAYTSMEVKKYPWLVRNRPNYEFALSKGLYPDVYAHDSKCRLLFSQPKERLRPRILSRKLAIGASESPRAFSEEPIFPVGEGRYNSMPTMAWLDEPYKHDRKETCKRKRKKRTGTDHLKEKITRKVHKNKPNKPRRAEDNLDAQAAKTLAAMQSIGCSATARSKPNRNAGACSKQEVDSKGKKDRQQVGSVPENPRNLIVDDEAVGVPWVSRPLSVIACLLGGCCSIASKTGDAHCIQPAQSMLIRLNYIINHMRDSRDGKEEQQRWKHNAVEQVGSWLTSGHLPQADVHNLLRRLQLLYPVLERVDKFLAMPVHINAQGTLMSRFGSMRAKEPHAPISFLGNIRNLGSGSLFDQLFVRLVAPQAKVHVYDPRIPHFRDFVPVGTPPNWLQGGSENLVFRAIAWYHTDFDATESRTDYAKIMRTLRETPSLIPYMLSEALDGVEQADDPDKWLESHAYHNRNEYTTLLENVLQRPIPYWNKIEPVLMSFQAGVFIFRTMKAVTTKDRVIAAMGVVVMTYTQHALASRSLIGLLKDASSCLYKAILKIVEILEVVWRKMSPDREQSLFDAPDVVSWFTKLTSCIDSEFSRKFLQAIAMVGAVVTCPWKTLNESSISAWADKALAFLSTTSSAFLKKASFLEKFFEVVKFFFIRARLAWTYKDFGLFFYGRDEFNALIGKINTLVDATKMLAYMSTTWSETLVNGVPFNVESYESLIKEIGTLAKQIEADVRDKKIIDLPSSICSALSRYSTCVATYEAFRKNQRNRPLPFVIPMVGPPSAGKNTLLEEIVEKLFKVCKFPVAVYDLVDGVPTYVRHEFKVIDPCVWTANAFDEYASGFTNMHNVVSFIEPTLAHPSTADGITHGFAQLASFFSFVDTAPYAPVMAGVDDKGKMSASGILLAVVSANDDSFNRWMLTCQMALMRRLGYLLIIHPWRQHRDAVTGGLDKATIRPTEFKTDDDMWYFEVQKPVARGQWNPKDTSVSADWETDTSVGEGGFIYTNQDLMEWLVARLTRHFEEQTAVMTKADNARKAECCAKCYRFKHTASQHCSDCGGLNCQGGPCICSLALPLSGVPSTCPICCGVATIGCAACDERDHFLRAIDSGRIISGIVSVPGNPYPDTRLPSHCKHCYRMTVAPTLGYYQCYGCKNICDHSLRKFFMQGFTEKDHYSTSAEGLDSLITIDTPPNIVADYISGCGGDEWVKTHYKPPDKAPITSPLRYGTRQQMGRADVMYLAGGIALGLGTAFCVSRLVKPIRVEHMVRAGDESVAHGMHGIGYIGNATRTLFRQPFFAGVEYPEHISDMTEMTWYSWARGNVAAFAETLCSFELSDWLALVTIVSLIASTYGMYRLICSPEDSAQKTTVLTTLLKEKEGPINIVVARAAAADSEQSGIFDSKFITGLMDEAGLTTGARNSSKSAEKIDNPWMAQVKVGVRTNLGKRTAFLGTKQVEQATDRISRSIYNFVGVTSGSYDDLSGALRTHGLFLGGRYFIVNAHFIMGLFARRIANLKQLDDLCAENLRHEIMCIRDWGTFCKIVKEYGLSEIDFIIGSKYKDDGCVGVSSETRERISLEQMSGCIFSDVVIIKCARVAIRFGGGLVYNIDDISRGLLLPKEHNAPTFAVLYPASRMVCAKSMNLDSVSVATAVYSPMLTTEVEDAIGGREVVCDAWSMCARMETDEGDCGLPLMGIFHTKYTKTDEGTKIPDPDGDTIGILGMHRLYSPSRQTIHCAPLSIDLISMLLGRLDSQVKDIQQVGTVYVHNIRDFGCGKVPTKVPRVSGVLCRSEELDWSAIFHPDAVDVMFKSGTHNCYHDKSPLQWMGKGLSLDYAPELGEAYALHGEAIGSVSGFRQGCFKTSVTRLPLANYFGFEQKHFPPNLNDKRGKERNLVAMSGATNGSLSVPLLEKVKADMISEIIQGLDGSEPKWRDTVHPLSDAETIVGAADTNFTPAVNRSTGMGFPFYGSKENHILVARDSKGQVSNITVRDSVLHEISRFVSAYSRLERANPVFTATPKDERISGSKITPLFDINNHKVGEVHDLRIFLCGSYPFIHLQRQQYLSVIRLICDKPEIFGMAVGTNVASARWGLMRDWLTWDGLATSTILAGDYSKFDKRMTSTWIIAAFEVLLSIMVASGNYQEGDIRVAEGIAWDTAIPLIDWFGDWFFVTNGHPSGHALTTIVNGVVNRLYLRYAYYVLWGQYHKKDPRQCSGMINCVRTYVYGDDNISGVIGEAVNFYTMPQICAELAKVGVILTTEDKTAVIDDFTTMDQASFLKRKWVQLEERWMAPLARKSIEAMVTVGVLNHVDTNTQMYQILRSFLDEHFHYGRDAYNDARSMIIQLCEDTEYWVSEGFPLVGVVLKQQYSSLGDSFLPRYEDVVHRWERASYVPIC